MAATAKLDAANCSFCSCFAHNDSRVRLFCVQFSGIFNDQIFCEQFEVPPLETSACMVLGWK